MNKNKNFDVCVIGAGSAGLSVASGVAQLGLTTALIEKAEMGGDCLNTGCVPSKSLLAAAKNAHAFRSSKKFGITPQEPEIDFSAVKKHVDDVIAQIAPHDSQARFEKLGVTVFREEAKFIDTRSLQVGSDIIKAKYFVIATGSRPKIPKIIGLNENKILTNETIFDLSIKPKHLVIIGGGPIGIEMAQAHRRLGSEVTVIDTGHILSHDDKDVVDILREILKDEGINIVENAIIQSVEHEEEKVNLNLEDGSVISGSHLLVATGRKPNIESLNLKDAKVDFNDKGIIVDSGLESAQKNIFAAGDVSGSPQFTHVAGYHAGILVRHIAFKMWFAKTNYSALPWVTYTEPALAHVGMTLDKAVKKHGKDNVRTISKMLEDNDRAKTERQTKGTIKIIALKNGKILGVSILAPHAGDLIGIWTLAITKKMKLKDIAGIIAPYPTLGEINKHVAGEWYKESLFSNKTKKFVKILQRLPF